MPGGVWILTLHKRKRVCRHNVYSLQKCKWVDKSPVWGHLWWFLACSWWACPVVSVWGKAVVCSPIPILLSQKGCTPHPPGTARVITHGKKFDSFPKWAVASPGLERGGVLVGCSWTLSRCLLGAQWEESEATFSHQNKTSQIPWPFKTVSKPQDSSGEGQ